MGVCTVCASAFHSSICICGDTGEYDCVCDTFYGKQKVLANLVEKDRFNG